MNTYNDVIESLKNGKELMFLRQDGTSQRFKVKLGKLYCYEKGDWVERTYLPQWTDLEKGRWFIAL